MIKENPRLQAAANDLRKTGVKVGDAVSEALKTMEESELMRAVSIHYLHWWSIISYMPSLDFTRLGSRLKHHRLKHRAYSEHGGLQNALGDHR